MTKTKEAQAPKRTGRLVAVVRVSWLAGFLLIGLLLGLTGSLLIAWQYHLDIDPRIIGLHFLGLNAGYVIAGYVSQRAIARVGLRWLAVASCALGVGGLAALSFAAPPVFVGWRIFGLALAGAAAGGLMTALLNALSTDFESAPAVTADRAGVLFGCGCLLATLMVALTYFASSIEIQTGLLAIVPLAFGILYARGSSPTAPPRSSQHETLRDMRSVAAVLFSVLLFFQFGSEWTIAGWLPLYLTRRLGTNPAWAIVALAGYFLALMLGRLGVRALLPRVSHPPLLLASVSLATAGYLILSLTTGMIGAWIAILAVAAGFAPIYPLIAETLDDRFAYHPGLYHGLFSMAITGAMFMPWMLGYVDAYLGIGWVMVIPALGSVAVTVVALLIMLEARVMAGEVRPSAKAAGAGGR